MKPSRCSGSGSDRRSRLGSAASSLSCPMGQLGGSPLRGPLASRLGGAALLRQMSGEPEPTYEPDEHSLAKH